MTRDLSHPTSATMEQPPAIVLSWTDFPRDPVTAPSSWPATEPSVGLHYPPTFPPHHVVGA